MNFSRIPIAASLVTATVISGVVAGHAAGATTVGLASSSGSAAPTPTGASFVSGRLLLRFRSGTSTAQQSTDVRGVGAMNAGSIRQLGVKIVEVPAGAEQRVATALLRTGHVAFAERDAVVNATDVTPNDPYWASQWGPKKIGAGSAWVTTQGSATVTVAVLDSGLNTSLAEFAGRVLPGYNFVANNADVTDDNGHGTQVAGVALAQGNNNTSVAGMCWACQILPVKVLDANAQGTDSGVASGITWAADHGARVINLSLGSTSASSTEASAVSYAQSKGALVVAAAGNNGTSDPFYPASISGVLSVAASDQYDNLFSYSEYGSWVDVAAPGSNYTVAPSGSTFNFGGTSSASPVVAGLAGLLMSAKSSATSSDVAKAITGTTDPLSGGTVATGRVNAASALAALTGTSPTPSATPSPSPAPTSSSTPPPGPTPTPTATSSGPSPTPSTGSTSAPAPTTQTLNGNMSPGSTKSFTFTTSGGAVTASVAGTSASTTLSILSGGRAVASATGGAGTSVSATLPAGAFTVSLKAAGGKTKFTLTVKYLS